MTTHQQLRQGLVEATRTLDETPGHAPIGSEFIYLPPSHARALDWEATLVEGIRGAGKSFWWRQLAQPAHQQFLQGHFRELRWPAGLQVRQGFGAGLAPAHWPDADTLVDLVRRHTPRAIWRAVIGVHAGLTGEFAQQADWQGRVAWVEAQPEAYAQALDAADQALASNGQHLLVLFDALDRLADDWAHIHPLAKGLLQVALNMRSTRCIRCKVFVRPDSLQEPQITSFPDFSKLLASKASLEWRRADLYALLFQRLGNTDDAALPLQQWAAELLQQPLPSVATRPWQVPARLRTDEALQEQLFERIAGRAMGSSTKRGKPYSWLINHLVDGLGQVSPRSFLAALGEAAGLVAEEIALAIDYRSIQVGVKKASAIRAAEIVEDYPWVRLVMAPLAGRLTVPCRVSDIDSLWKAAQTLDGLASKLKLEQIKLPPAHLAQGTQGVLLDLAALGMVQHIEEHRVQVPDTYRIAYGMGRRGGVTPLK